MSSTVSFLAAAVGLLGCAVGVLGSLQIAPVRVNPLVIFGVYCLLIGYLIVRSNFLPGILDALMAVGGLGWLAFLSAPLARQLSPYNFAPGMIGEGALTLWLLARGVDSQRWNEQARAAQQLRSHMP